MADLNNNNHEGAGVVKILHKQKKKKKKEREVKYIPFPDDTCSQEDEDIYNQYSDKAQDDAKDHIEIKKEVEERRLKFGTGWLVHNVSPSFLPTSNKIDSSQLSSSIGAQELFRPPVKYSETDIENSPVSEKQQEQLNDNRPECIRSPSITSPGIYTKPFFSPPGISTDESASETDDSDESELFFAHHSSIDDPIMLKLGSTHLVESDGMSGKKNQSWSLGSLLSAEMIKEGDKSCVVLKFDSLSQAKQGRTYWMESFSSATMFLKLLHPVLYKNSHEYATNGALQCLKCESEFSESLVKNYVSTKTNESTGGELSREYKTLRKCPNCHSTSLVELLQKPGNPSSLDNSKELPKFGSYEKEDFTRSPAIRPRSVSLVNKVISLNPSKISGPKGEENESTSSSSIECIFTSGDDSGEKSTQQSQSDITVLSNPSQSSIAVISQSCSSVSTSSDQDLSSTPVSRCNFGPSVSARLASSPVDISLPHRSCDIPWYDSSSTKTTVLHSPSPKTWNMSELCESFASCEPGADSCKVQKIEQESERIWQILEQKDDMVYSATKINHQVKLYMVVNVFEDEEDFVAGINGGIVTESTKQEVAGLLILSTKRFYFFKENHSDINTNDLHFEELEKLPVRNLTDVYTLLGSQGFGLSFLPDNLIQKTVLVILKNADFCNSFLVSFEGIIKNMIKSDGMISEPSFQLLTNEILLNVQNEIVAASTESDLDQSVRLFLLGSVRRPTGESRNATNSVAIVVTSHCLYLARVLYFMQSHDPSLHFQLLESQEIGNLTEVHLKDDMRSASLHFLDEDLGQEEYWLFTAESKSSLGSLLTILRSPWEELFGIDLELAINKDCVCDL